MLKVLLVDDNKNDLIVLEHYISKYFSCVIVTAQDGIEALEKVNIERPDVIFTDISMPVLDGGELINILSERSSGIPVIAVTAVYDKKIRNKMMDYGISDYLLKPINPFSIYENLEKIFEINAA